MELNGFLRVGFISQTGLGVIMMGPRTISAGRLRDYTPFKLIALGPRTISASKLRAYTQFKLIALEARAGYIHIFKCFVLLH